MRLPFEAVWEVLDYAALTFQLSDSERTVYTPSNIITYPLE
jgi:hypothetical protein